MHAERKPIKLKIVVVGDSGVGKTSLLNRYFFQGITPNRISIDLYQRKLKLRHRVVHLQVWDTVGQERYEALQSAFYRDADACVLVHDITRPASLDNLVRWRDQFLKHAQNDPDDQCMNVPIVVLSNNNDLSQTSLMNLHRKRTQRLIKNATCFDTDPQGSNLEKVFHEITLLTLEKKLEKNRRSTTSKVELNRSERNREKSKCSCII